MHKIKEFDYKLLSGAVSQENLNYKLLIKEHRLWNSDRV